MPNLTTHTVGERKMLFRNVIVDRIFLESVLSIVDEQPDLKFDVCYLQDAYRTRQLNSPTSDSILSDFDDSSELDLISTVIADPISGTFSCQTNSEVHCGLCPNCVDRLDALNKLDVVNIASRRMPEEFAWNA